MPSKLKKKEFDYASMKVKELYYNTDIHLPNEGVSDWTVRSVFGRDLMFGEFPEDRPYIFNSLVTSIDGRISFPDAQQGPLIARKNEFGGAGGALDYWVLNILRGAADAILVGTQSISTEVSSGGTGHCYDINIETRREQRSKDAVPWRIVVTLDGKDVAFEAEQFKNLDMSTFFYTTASGVDHLKQHSLKPVKVIGPYPDVDGIKIDDFQYDSRYAYVIVAGENNQFDHAMGLKILKSIGVNTLLVESPTITHIFMQEERLDELFINQSGVYIGGNTGMIGQRCIPFTSEFHPHTELISLHMHSPHFIYLRYRLIYSSKKK